MSSEPNPGIQRGMTAVPDHHVVSSLHLTLPWADAEALFITLDGVLSDTTLVAPSHLGAVEALRDLLAERIYVIREVVTRPSRVKPEPSDG